jgi:hypothetical protein
MPAFPPPSCCSQKPIPAALITSGSTIARRTASRSTTSATRCCRLKIGPKATLDDDEHAKNNLPDIAARWQQRSATERKRPRTAQSFCTPKTEIAAAGYDLSINRYKEVVHQATEHRPPKEIIAELKTLESEIADGLKELEGML